MSKIKVFTKSDQRTVSSFAIPDFRIVHPRTPSGKRVAYTSKYMFYRYPCEVHDGREASVVLDTYFHNPETDREEFLGARRYCFFCWSPVNSA